VSEGSSPHLYAPENAVNRPTASVLLEQGTPAITAEIEGVQRDLILDTGSNISILQPGVSLTDMRCTSVKPYGVTGETLEIGGQQTVSFVFNEHEFKHTFYVCSLPTKAAGLIGMDFMVKAGAKIDFEKGKISLAVISRGSKLVSASPTRQAALTVFPRGKEGHSPIPANRWYERKTTLDSSNSETTTSDEVLAHKSHRKYGRAKMPAGGDRKIRQKGESLPSLICTEPTMVPIQSVHPASTHASTNKVELTADVTTRPNSEVPRNCAFVMITNFSNEALMVSKATVLGTAEEISESVVDKIEVSLVLTSPLSPTVEKNMTLFRSC